MASSAGAPWPNVDPTPQALEDTLYSTESNSRLLASTNVSPQTISALISRIRALVQRLIPVEVEEESITGREGIIDGNVESAFDLAGGDFAEAVPYALLEARKTFLE